MNNIVEVSVVMPVYNEGKYIKKCIDSLLEQDYPLAKMEWIFVDGNSNDETVNIITNYASKHPGLIYVYSNPKKIVSFAMNIGISKSRGKYIIRLDAHADYPSDYISKCIYYLEQKNADNVGGVAETKANSFVGKAIAKMLSSKFGVGNSQFRTNGKSGYVDTVPFGAFKRDVFKKYGGYDERLVRNQDNEMNFRIRKNGGKIYLANDIRFSYYCRDSVKGIALMAKENGKWNVITMKLCKGAMGIRHFIPLVFVISILSLLILGFFYKFFWLFLGAEMLTYLTLDIVFSFKNRSSFAEMVALLVLFPIFHISYGCGSIIGFLKLCTKKYRKSSYKPHNI